MARVYWIAHQRGADEDAHGAGEETVAGELVQQGSHSVWPWLTVQFSWFQDVWCRQSSREVPSVSCQAQHRVSKKQMIDVMGELKTRAASLSQ